MTFPFHSLMRRVAALAASALSAASGLSADDGRASPAGGAGDYVTIGGEFRPRFMMMHNFNVNETLRDENEFVYLRTRLRVDVEPAERVFVRVAIQDFRRWGDPASNASALTDAADIVLREGYAEFMDLWNGRFTARVGRQAIILGSERVFGDLDWHRVGRTHDAAMLTMRTGGESAWDLIAIDVSEADNIGTTAAAKGGGVDADGWLVALYGRLNLKPFARFEPYWIYQDYDSSTLPAISPRPTAFGGTDGDLKLHTLGLLAAGEMGNRWSWDAEGNWQGGTLGSRDVSAWFAHAGISYEARLRHLARVAVAYDHYSGDDDPLDRDVGTYQPVFPSYYEHTGLIGRIGMKNLSRFRLSLGGELVADWSWRFDWHAFRLAAKTDHAYAVDNTAAFATGNAVSSATLGHEYDMILSYPWNRNVTLTATGSVFDPGAAIDQVVAAGGGTPGAITNVIGQVEVKF
jgi:hypothetical protein